MQHVISVENYFIQLIYNPTSYCVRSKKKDISFGSGAETQCNAAVRTLSAGQLSSSSPPPLTCRDPAAIAPSSRRRQSKSVTQQ